MAAFISGPFFASHARIVNAITEGGSIIIHKEDNRVIFCVPLFEPFLQPAKILVCVPDETVEFRNSLVPDLVLVFLKILFKRVERTVRRIESYVGEKRLFSFQLLVHPFHSFIKP